MATLLELSNAVDGELRGPGDLLITGVASLESAGPDDIAPLDSERFMSQAEASKAGALLISKKIDAIPDRPCIVSPFPLVALNTIMEVLDLVRPPPRPGIHATAVVEDGAQLGEDVYVGPHAVVAAGAVVGARTALHAGVVVEGDVAMGEDCVIEPGAVLHDGCTFGDRVRVGANAVVSRQGFGFAPGPAGPVRLHHIGRVVLEDDVHVGAGTTIDRARFDETHVGAMSALDNLVHVGHNCRIGRRTFIAAQTGFAGRAGVGDECEVGGQVGITRVVGNRARLGAQCGVIKDWGDDVELWGTPARDKRYYLRQLARLKKLVEEKE